MNESATIIESANNSLSINLNDLWFIVPPILTIICCIMGMVALFGIAGIYFSSYIQKREYEKERWESKKIEFKQIMNEGGYEKRMADTEEKIKHIENLELDVRLNEMQMASVKSATQMEGLVKSVDGMKLDIREVRNLLHTIATKEQK